MQHCTHPKSLLVRSRGGIIGRQTHGAPPDGGDLVIADLASRELRRHFCLGVDLVLGEPRERGGGFIGLRKISAI